MSRNSRRRGKDSQRNGNENREYDGHITSAYDYYKDRKDTLRWRSVVLKHEEREIKIEVERLEIESHERKLRSKYKKEEWEDFKKLWAMWDTLYRRIETTQQSVWMHTMYNLWQQRKMNQQILFEKQRGNYVRSLVEAPMEPQHSATQTIYTVDGNPYVGSYQHQQYYDSYTNNQYTEHNYSS